MHLKKLSGSNWKGGNFNLALGLLNIITGENQVGKSAIAEAVRVALLGYSPEHGKKTADTFGFAGAKLGASSMELVGLLSDGRPIMHKWKQGKKGAVKYDGENPLELPPVLLDINDYLERSGPDKVRFIFNRLDLAGLGFGLDRMVARLKREVKVETPTEVSEAALGQLVDDITELDEVRGDVGQSLQEWMDAVIEKIKKNRDEAQAIVESMTGTITGTSAMAAGENAAPIRFDADALTEARRK